MGSLNRGSIAPKEISRDSPTCKLACKRPMIRIHPFEHHPFSVQNHFRARFFHFERHLVKTTLPIRSPFWDGTSSADGWKIKGNTSVYVSCKVSCKALLTEEVSITTTSRNWPSLSAVGCWNSDIPVPLNEICGRCLTRVMVYIVNSSCWRGVF